MKNYPVLLFLSAALFMSCEKYKIRQPPNIPPAPPPTGIAKSYFVSDLLGSDVNTGTAASVPLKLISTAASKAVAGDTVFIMNGTYATSSGAILNITKSGDANNYITYKNFPGHSPKLFASGNVWNLVVVNGSYIVLEGLELMGNNAALTYAGAYQSFTDVVNGGPVGATQASYNTNAISIGGPNTESKKPHHVIIRNCKVHDFPGGGISSIQADYTTIEGNTVYNNAWYMMYAGSGISILNPYDVDAVTTYKNYVRNNICYGNKTTVPWIGLTPPRLSDGNGIILDVNQYPYGGSASSNLPYNGRTLVENNVSYNNGGSGIHAYRADHVDIINNTAYNNGSVVGYAEIFANDCKDVKIINNIMYARTGNKPNSNTNNTNVTYNYNIYFNGTPVIMGANDKTADPKFVNLSIDPLLANFSLNAGSPAIDAGTSGIFATKDVRGIARPQGAAIDCGAYEYKP